MQLRHRSVRIALRDINKKGVEIDERQNRCQDDCSFKTFSCHIHQTVVDIRNCLYRTQYYI